MINKNIAFSLAIAAIGIGFCSCDPDVEIPGQGDAEKHTMIYMPQAEGGPKSLTLPIKDVPAEIVLGAACGGIQSLDKDVTVSIEIDPSLIESYNVTKGTNYTMLPEDAFTLSSNSVTIARGSTSSSVMKVIINTQKVIPFKTYMLAAKIQSNDGAVAVNEKLKEAYFIVSTQPDLNDYPSIDRTLWSVNSFSTEEPAEAAWGNGGQVVHALDGLNNTFWHTKWNGGEAQPPHWFVIDLGEMHELHGLSFLTRQSDNSGKPKDVVVELSENGTDWFAGGSMVLKNTSTIQHQFLTDGFNNEARYVKITVTSTYGANYTHLAEIFAF
jgi:hypothetical protein